MPADTAQRAAALRALLDGCTIRDRARLGAKLRGGRQTGRRRARGLRPPPDGQALDAIARDIDAARAHRERRSASVPGVRYPEQLPVVERRDEIMRAIDGHRVVVICGETGSGKTTQLPKMCLDLGRGVGGMIGHTQPRRIAARSVAARIAQELGVPLGRSVGYKVRFGDRTDPLTHVKVMTDGVLLAETQHDRRLEQYDTIIVDEAHERSLNIDFLLGVLHRLLPKRPDLKLIITSATIDPERFAEHFAPVAGGEVPVINVSGRTYPVEIRYRPLDTEPGGPRDEPPERDPLGEQVRGIIDAVDELAAHDAKTGRPPGDVLVFLPGEREIREAAEALGKHHVPGRTPTEVLPLLARLSADEQQRVFAPHRGRRIVLATNVAETSLTVPGIVGVVDTGVARISRYSARSRVQRLPVERVSRASADQRAGRCGRVAPGVCIRLFSEEDLAQREEFTPPEIVRTNLASVILQMKALKLGDVTDFPFLDPPDHRLIHDGYETLHELGAVDDDGALTDIGRRLARLPIDPSLGRILLAAEDEDALAEVLVIASALAAQDPRDRPFDRRDAADEAHAQFADERSDFLALLNVWRFYREQKQHLSGSKLRKACKQNFLSFVRLREWEDTHRQLKRLLTEMGHATNDRPAEYDAIHRALLAGLAHNIGALKDPPEYVSAGGARFRLFPGSGLFGSRPKWVIAAEMVRTTQLYARTVAKIDPAWVERVAPHLIRKRHGDPFWDAKTGRVLAHERVTLRGLDIVPKRIVHFGPIDEAASRTLFIHHALVEGEWTSNAPFRRHNDEMVARVRTMEAKARRRDLLADERRLFAFFDARVPADAWSVSRFERWRKRAERDDPRILFLAEADVLAGDASDVTEDRFPDRLVTDARRFDLRYRFEPGRREDGVTVTVPVEHLGALDPRAPEWVVPGLLTEKVTALIKQLPKTWRKQFVPAPEVALRVAGMLAAAPTRGRPLLDAVAEALGTIAGARLTPDLWRGVELPDHLRMNIRVIDHDGGVLGEGRDLGALRRSLADRLGETLRTIDEPRWTRDGLTRWDVGDLPERVELQRHGRLVVGTPALVDQGEAVALRLLADPGEAAEAHRRGVRRLAWLELRDAIGHVLDARPEPGAMRVLAASIGDAGRGLDEDLALLVTDLACVADLPAVRTAQGFDARLDEGWNRLNASADRACALASSVLRARHAADLAMSAREPHVWMHALDDAREQIGDLFPERFFTAVQPRWLAQYPRYLAALKARFEKLERGAAAGAQRDREHTDLVSRFVKPWRARARRHADEGVRDPELERFRWMIEEFRVSLFAQELGTSMKVSPQRLLKQWEKTKA